MKNQFEPTNSNLLSEDFSNFRVMGIGKQTDKQKKKQVRRVEKRAIAKEERKGMSVGKRILNVTQKANPAAVVPRSSFLLALRVNLFGLARKLYPATLTDAELKAKDMNLENAKKAREALRGFSKVWTGLGGRTVSLSENIRKGFDKPIFKTKKIKEMKAKEKAAEEKNKAAADVKTTTTETTESFDGNTSGQYVEGALSQIFVVRPVVDPFNSSKPNVFDIESFEDKNITNENFDSDVDMNDVFSNVSGYDDAAIAAYITSGLGIVGALAKHVTSKGVSKNPYNQNSPEYKAAQKDIERAEKEGDMNTPKSNDAQLRRIANAASSDAKKGIKVDDDKVLDSEGNVIDDKIWGMPKTVVYIGGALLVVGLIWGGYKLIKGKKIPATA